MSTRTQLGAHLRTALDKSFAVIDAETMPDQIDKTTVVIRHRNYTPGPAAAALLGSYIVTVVSAKRDPIAAENDLDTSWPTVLAALRLVRSMVFVRATKVAVKELYFGFDIEITIPATVANL